MSKDAYLKLQHSESVVAMMAATIFAGYVQREGATPENEDALVKRALQVALKLAAGADKAIKSDEEWMRVDAGNTTIL